MNNTLRSAGLEQSGFIRWKQHDQRDYKRKSEYRTAITTTFLDSRTGKEFDYYIYVGNWP